MPRRWLSALVCAGLTVGALSAVTVPARADTPTTAPAPPDPDDPSTQPPSTQTPPAQDPDAPPDETEASTRAAELGTQVEVGSATSETEQTFAQPDGSFVATTTAHPTRVKRGTTWVPVDTTLHPNANGTLSPGASSPPITFSGGGSTAPMVAIGEPGSAVSLGWSGTLPTPTVSGSSALYHNVFPGVDLRLTAHADSYSEVLVIHDATAAANPALANLTLTGTGDGLTVTAAADGQLSATNVDGTEVLHGSTPEIWDSSVDPTTGATPTADDPGSAKVNPVTVRLVRHGGSTGADPGIPPNDTADADTGVDLTLSPPASALTGAGVTYPVFFDPGMTGAKQHYAVVTSGGMRYYDDTTQDAKVGDCDWAGCNGIGVARSYFQLNTAAISGRAVTAKIYSADFAIVETHNANACTAQPVNLYQTGAFNSGIAWPGPLTTGLQSVSSNVGDSCAGAPANTLHFNNANVVNYLQAVANGDHTNVTFGLAAPNEGDRFQWKRFQPNPSLTIHYNFPPNAPTALTISNAVNCNGHIYTADAFPRLYARATDNNPSPLQLGLFFELWNSAHTARGAANTAGVRINSNTLGNWVVNRTGGVGNQDWSYRVLSENLPSDTPHLRSGYSGWFNFTSRAIPPAQAPWVGSYDYAGGNYWGPPAGTPAAFMLNGNGASHVIGFSYTWAGAGTEPALTTTTCNYNQTVGNGGYVAATNGNASLPVPSTLTPGLHTLRVRSFDEAHNLSPESTAYTFYVAPNFGVTQTKLQVSDATQVTLSQPSGQAVAFSKQAGGDTNFWSGGDVEQFPTTVVGQSFSLTFKAPLGAGGTSLEADYALGLKQNLTNAYGQFRVDLDDTPLNNTDTTPLDFYNAGNASRYVPLGGVHFAAGQTHTLKFTVKGKNAANTNATGFGAGLDYLSVVPFNNVTTASFGAAMNNHGTGVDGTTAADLDLAGGGLSPTALATAGWTPGAAVTVAGARFSLPVANPATGNDNVIAAGQTVPMAAGQQVKATALGMLVASTCGATRGNVKGRVDYTDGTFSNPSYVSVPDWIATTSGGAVALDHHLWGTGAAAGAANVYALFLPTDPTKTLKSVTLPMLGTTFMSGSCSPALHVLAMAPRPVAAGWLGTWAATTESAATPAGGAGLANQTLRLVVHPTITGTNARIRVSNTFANKPVTIDAASVAAQAAGPATLAAPVALTFCAATGQAAGCGVHGITLPGGGEAYSDPVAFPATTGGSGNLSVSLHLPAAVTAAPVHNAGNTTNYLANGSTTADSTGAAFTTTTTASYFLTAVDVSTTDSTKGTIAVLGDPTSAAGPPGGTYQPTWVDDLPAKLGAELPGGLVNASLNTTAGTGFWRGSEVGNTLNLSVLDEPNLRTVIVAVGAQDVLQGAGVDAIRSNITNIVLNPSSAYGIKYHRRADGGLVHVILATIPPLGLASTDARERVRTDLNTAIRTAPANFGADEVIDYDAAVRDPAHPSNINPTLLTGGTPNAAYHNTFAQALVDATETFPPGAQL